METIWTRSRRRAAAAGSGMVLVAVATFGGVAAAAESTPPADTDLTFRVGILQDVDSLNPFKGITAAAYEMWALMYDGLTRYGAKDFKPEPGLAASWEHSEDGLVWTYHLRKGVTFNDGEPMTADDVVYTYERIMNGRIEKTNYGSYVAQIKSVEALDENTVVMTLKKPTPLMERQSIPILPEHIWSQIGDDEVRKYTNEPGADPQGGVGTGPFILTEAREGQFYTLERNDDYWGGPAHIEAVQFQFFRNADAMVQALKTGQIDFADDLDANIFASLEGTPDIEARESVYYGFNYLTMNGGAALADGTPIGNGHPSLKDPRVRLAINYAINKEALVDRTLDGRGAPGTSVIPPLYPEHYEPADPVSYDPAEANRILDEAGYAKGSDGIRRMPDGTDPLVYTMYARQNSETSQTTIKFLQGWLKDIGIESTVETVSEGRLYEIAGEGTFDIYEWGWVVEPDPDYQLSTFTCEQRSYQLKDGTIYAGLNDSFFCDEHYDELYVQQSTETDRDTRTEIAQEMQQIAYEANAYIVTMYYNYLQAYRTDRFTGFVPQPDPDGAILFQYGTYSYLNITPTSAGSAGGDINVGMVAGVAAAVAVAAAGAVWLSARYRKAHEEDTE